MEYLLLALTALVLVFAFFLMRTRRYYFVRHGETLLNKQHVKQGEAGALSEKGKQQARKVGVALEGLHIGRIYSSPYERAKETALILAAYLRAPVTYSPLLVERRNPSAIIGKSTYDPEVEHVVDLIDLAYHADEYRYADEENFTDLRERAERTLRYLARQPRSRVCVVTHHAFLKMVLAYGLYRDRLNAKDFVRLSFFNTADNAGITTCEYRPWRMFSATRGWSIIAYNEIAD